MHSESMGPLGRGPKEREFMDHRFGIPLRFSGCQVRGTLGFGVLLLGTAFTRGSLACGASPNEYFTFEAGAATPADGASGVPRNGAVLLEGTAWVNDPPGPLMLAVTVVEQATGSEVSGQALNWSYDPAVVAWSPLEPLKSETAYALTAKIEEAESTPPEGVDGATSLTMAFTTGTSLTPDLALDGSIAAELEPYEADVEECTAMCAPCTVVGKRSALGARISLPAVSGGFESGGYRAWLWLSDETPRQFEGPGDGFSGGEMVGMGESLAVEPGEHASVFIEIPEEDAAYRPCFAYNVWDAAGRNVVAESLCLEAVKPSEYLAALEGEGGGAGGSGGAAGSGGDPTPSADGGTPGANAAPSRPADSGSDGSGVPSDEAGTASPEDVGESNGCTVAAGGGARSVSMGWGAAAVLGLFSWACRRRWSVS